jgi:hypothetical protein
MNSKQLTELKNRVKLKALRMDLKEYRDELKKIPWYTLNKEKLETKKKLKECIKLSNELIEDLEIK